jgi:hypothetical protein
MSAKWIARTPPKRQVEGSNPSGPENYVKNGSQTSGQLISIIIKKMLYLLSNWDYAMCLTGKLWENPSAKWDQADMNPTDVLLGLY